MKRSAQRAPACSVGGAYGGAKERSGARTGRRRRPSQWALAVALLVMLSGHGYASNAYYLFDARDGSNPPTDLPRVTVTAPKFEDWNPYWFGSVGANFGHGGDLYGGDAFTETSTADEQQTDDKQDASSCDKETTANPVVLSTGNKVEPELDFASGGEMGLFLQRTYNHHWSAVGLFGGHWLSNFDYTLAPSSDGSLLWAQRPDGRRIKFVKTASGDRWNEDKAAPVAYIVRNTDGSYLMHNEARGSERYNADGYITELRNEHGVAWTFAYDGKYLQQVTHSSGRSVRFAWSNGQLVQVTDPAGAVYQYSYAANALGTGRHRLASATLPGTPSTTIHYHYEDSRFPGALTGKSFGGVRYSTFVYDAQARAISTEHAGGVERYTLSYAVESTEQVAPPPAPPPPGGYDMGGGGGGGGWCEYQSGTGQVCYQPLAMPVGTLSTARVGTASSASTKTIPYKLRVTETNPLGKQTIHHFEDDRKVRTEGVASPHCLGASQYIAYDANGYKDETTDFAGNKTHYDYDAHGFLLKKVEAVGTPVERVTTYDWDLARKLPLRIAVAGDRETGYEYEPDGRLKAVTVKNLKASGVPGQTRTVRYAYTKHGNGLLASMTVDGPLANDTVTYTYSSQGDLLAVQNELGHTTTYANYDAMGRPGKVTGPNGDVTEYAYDARGRVLVVRTYPNGAAAETRYAYHPNGLLGSVTLPDGTVEHYVYDAALRLVEKYRPDGAGGYERVRYAYNALSQPIEETVSRSDHAGDTRIVGNIDGVAGSEASGYTITGWACTTGSNLPIDVHLYLGGPYGGGGAFVGSYRADKPSEPAVAAACQASGAAYRFQIPLPLALREQHYGKPIYLHGISPAGNGNLLISQSGVYRVPGEVPASAPLLNAPGVNTTGSYTVSWTGVAYATRYQLDESVNGGAWTQVYNAGGGGIALSRNTSVPHSYRVRACNAFGCGPYSATASVQQPIYGAEFVGQSVPSVMVVGRAYTVTVQMRNTGNTVWTDAEGYRLGSQNPGDNTRWGTHRVAVPGSVAPGGIATFTFNVAAPTSAGTHNFQWRMVRDGYAWFGAQTPNVGVSVASGSIGASPNACGLYIGQITCTSQINWSSTRPDAEVWASNIDNSGAQLFARAQSGGQYASWISTSGTRFHLKVAGQTLATVDVYAYQTDQYPPEPPPTCVPNPPYYNCDPL